MKPILVNLTDFESLDSKFSKKKKFKSFHQFLTKLWHFEQNIAISHKNSYKMYFFVQSAITSSKIDEMIKNFFFEYLVSKLLKSVGFTKIGLELAIWRLVEVGANFEKNRFFLLFGQNPTLGPKYAIFCDFFQNLLQLQPNAKSRVLSRF